MATLVVIDYENELKAEEVRRALLKMQKEYLIDLADAPAYDPGQGHRGNQKVWRQAHPDQS
jgi:uncharacterized membrane protein